jgi:hypothetical protein
MDKNETVQLNLNEEQLQDATGGCSTCRWANDNIKMHDSWVATHTASAIASIKDKKYADATISIRWRQDHIDGIKTATKIREEAKRTSPGLHT